MNHEIKCAWCGNMFCIIRGNTRKKYCSESCRRKRWQQENKEYGLNKTKEFRKKNPGYIGPKRQAMVDKVSAIKESTPCKDCGRYYPACCMEFDHISTDKHAEIGKMVSRSRAWADIEAEMLKCEIVCSNCHRIRTRNGGSNSWTRKTLEKDEVPKSMAK